MAFERRGRLRAKIEKIQLALPGELCEFVFGDDRIQRRLPRASAPRQQCLGRVVAQDHVDALGVETFVVQCILHRPDKVPEDGTRAFGPAQQHRIVRHRIDQRRGRSHVGHNGDRIGRNVANDTQHILANGRDFGRETIQNLAENIARGRFGFSHQRARRGVDLAGCVIHYHDVDIVDFEIDFFDAPRFVGDR